MYTGLSISPGLARVILAIENKILRINNFLMSQSFA